MASEQVQLEPSATIVAAKIAENQYGIKVSLENYQSLNDSQTTIVLTLDISGSMYGERLNNGKSAYTQLIKNLVTPSQSVVFITYADCSRVYNININNLSDMLLMINRIDANGNTNFAHPLKNILDIIQAKLLSESYGNTLDVRVMFFTDGAANRGEEETTTLLRMMKEIIKHNNLCNLNFSTRAISNDSSTQFLSKIVRLGNGDHKYTNFPSGISSMILDSPKFVAIDQILDLVITTPEGKTHKCSVPLSENVNKLKIGECVVEMECKESDSISIQFNLGQSDQILICALDGPFAIKAGFIIDKIDSDFKLHKLTLVDGLLGKNHAVEDFHSFIEKVRDVEREALLIPDKMARRTVLEKSSALKSEINEFRLKFRNANARSNADVSKLMEYASFTSKKRFNTMLLDREARGIGIILDNEEKLKKNVEALTTDEISGMNSSELQCAISLQEVGEVVAAGSCLAKLFNAKRNETAVVTGMIDVESFYQASIAYDLAEDMMSAILAENAYSPEAVHGGFVHADTPESMKTVFRQKCNAYFPIYVCPKHWENSKLLLPQALAFAAALNPAAQTFDHLRQTLFCVVLRPVYDLSYKITEVTVDNFLTVARVAKAVITENNMKHINEDFPAFLKSPGNRTNTEAKPPFICIKSMPVFLVKLIFMQERPELGNEFFIAYIGEIIRREMKHGVKCLNLQNIDTIYKCSQYINIPKQSADAGEQKFISTFNAYLIKGPRKKLIEGPPEQIMVDDGSKSFEITEEKSFDVDATQIKLFNSQDQKLNYEIMEIIEFYEKACRNELRRLMRIMGLYTFLRGGILDAALDSMDLSLGTVSKETYHQFESFECKVPENPKFTDFISGDPDYVNLQMYFLILQAVNLKDNQDLFSALEKGTYVNVFDEDSHQIQSPIVNNIIMGKLSQANTYITNSRNGTFAAIFRDTNDMRVAVGILLALCKNIGDKPFGKLVSSLYDSVLDTPLHLEKVNLLVSWTYDGKDISRNRVDPELKQLKWAVTYSKAHKLMMANKKIRERQNIVVSSNRPLLKMDPSKMDPSGIRSDSTRLQKILTKAEWFEEVFKYEMRDGITSIRVGPPKQYKMKNSKSRRSGGK